MMKIKLIVDMQYGSTGKGLLAGYLAEKWKPDTIINCNMPNAGHTYIDSKMNKMIFKVLPNGIVSPNLQQVLIGPGSVFDPDRLWEEVEMARSFGYLGEDVEIWIHPNAVPMQERYRKAEQSSLSSISSTMQGSAAATIEKMLRGGHQDTLAKYMFEADLPIGVKIANHDSWEMLMRRSSKVLAEGSQGYSLGLNGRFWPYCTSRDCGPLRLMNDMGLPYTRDVEVWGTLRTYPIRVGNTPDGNSGGWYPDQEETSWEELGVEREFTTVTGRERRVATFSMDQLREAVYYVNPDRIFLNFVNYLKTEDMFQFIDDIQHVLKFKDGGLPNPESTKIDLLGMGPAFKDVMENPYGSR